jgi:hypothetical protein
MPGCLGPKNSVKSKENTVFVSELKIILVAMPRKIIGITNVILGYFQ